jgi:DNA-binding NarL/FixJ family response regulator
VNAPRVRALIAEDEPAARDNLREYLEDAPWIDVVAEAVDGRSALALANEHKPELLFLDVRLPELSGLEVARQIQHPAEIIFTTAYDRYAVAAFEIGALDYLVKPFGRERLAAATERVQRGCRSPASRHPTASELPCGPLPRPPPDRETASSRSLSADSPIQAQGDYAEVHAAEGGFCFASRCSLAVRLGRPVPPGASFAHRQHGRGRAPAPVDDCRLAVT